MMDHRSKMRVQKTRIELTNQDLQRFSDTVFSQSIPTLVKRTGLSYMLIYNVAHRRVKSISDRNYRILFGEAPPARLANKVHGQAFRAMVELWLFLNDGVTKSGLYREFYGKKHPKRVDYRIFSGQIKMVEPRLERKMRQKFSDAGINQQTLAQWMHELAETSHDERVSYGRIRPILIFLQTKLGIHPTRILKRSFGLYESGKLKSVSRNVYSNAIKLKKRAEKVLETGDSLEIKKLKEEIYGGKAGYTLYAEVREELNFLRKYAKKSPKRYLGRGTRIYEKRNAKRIASWRVAKIFDDCDRFIRQTPRLLLSVLPRSRQKMVIQPLLWVLVGRSARMLSKREGIVFEKQILSPSYASNEYKKQNYGFTEFDRVSSILGMRKKAFDLMVANNCEMFRKAGRYDKRWYLSDLYLRELSKNEFFELLAAKYEIMAKEINHHDTINECMY